ncbi:uncharacterized protein NEMAJ01_1271 [Nematocida major]|uniref:uncharacterized protein n=1 Tax=Nematocida major TaxID=1912982 RepID=UPI0020085C5E|nr:uncharacterized protein NEMAJ01_1271 [Nematocida major]KAH9386375.1 hypothetical protein NEMAJ01_1271 [Nematocida major]
MHEEGTETFELMDIMRYMAPTRPADDTPEKVLEALREYTPRYLYDIYLFAPGTPIRALLHPCMYTRILKGWLKIGSIVRITHLEGDMIVSMESMGKISAKDLTAIKRNAYVTLPDPIFNKRGYYMPLLSDEGYMKWDRRWKTYLEKYSSCSDDVELLLELESDPCRKGPAMGLDKETPNNPGQPCLVKCALDTEEGIQELQVKRRRTEVGYVKTQQNLIQGQVILKSRLFTFSRTGNFPLFFAFVLLTSIGPIKVYVWELAVRKFFCVKEGDYVSIRGFKIRRRRGALTIADRIKTDADTKYGSLPEINVNICTPVGHIMEMDKIPGLPAVSQDPEFTTVVGMVEYMSSLLRYAEKEKIKSFKEYVLLKVSGTAVKLISNGILQSVLEINIGEWIEIRHLRKGCIGEFEFYVSSLYTQFYCKPPSAPLFDKHVLTGECTGFAEGNAVGYIPVCFSTFNAHISASMEGIGALKIRGVPIPRESPDSAYIKKDKIYFGSVCSLQDALKDISMLYLDESARFIVFGKILGVRYNAQGDPAIGNDTFDVSYIAADTTVCAEQDLDLESEGSSEMCRIPFNDRIEENAVIRFGSEGCHVDIKVFQNHLVHRSFEESVLDFLKVKSLPSGSIYSELDKRVGEKCYFVFDAIRINEEDVLHVGVSLLT